MPTTIEVDVIVRLVVVWISLFGLAACAASPPPAASASGSTRDIPIEVSQGPLVAELPRVKVASGLPNPRGMHINADGSLYVAIAGTGDPNDPNSGGLWQLQDKNHDGDFDDADERSVLLDKQPSRNILQLVRRDEVFGMAGMAEGDGKLLVALADFGGPSTIFQIEGARVSKWGSTNGNINDLAFDARRHVWVAVASTTDEVVQLVAGGRSERIVKIPTLASGQDAVPAYLRFDPRTGDLLVALFSG
ncbi:MAG TPA: hypothetical protein VHZ95_00925, partial [Polyangiales bacterium]|nr:hypothetical protein [Polyangiales bacterium]